MNQNSPKASNLPHLSHYPLVPNESKRGLVYSFTTINELTYKLVFVPDSEYIADYPFADSVYSFTIAPDSGEAGPKDPRIKETVAYALNSAFLANPGLIITYVCSTDDEQQRHRRILFGQWYQQHGKGFTRLTHTDEDKTYSAAIFKDDHPQGKLIKQAFKVIYVEK